MKRALGWIVNAKKRRAYKVMGRSRKKGTLKLASAIATGLIFETKEINIDLHGYRWSKRKPGWLNKTRFHRNAQALTS